MSRPRTSQQVEDLGSLAALARRGCFLGTRGSPCRFGLGRRDVDAAFGNTGLVGSGAQAQRTGLKDSLNLEFRLDGLLHQLRHLHQGLHKFRVRFMVESLAC